jgi:hypothetical protein
MLAIIAIAVNRATLLTAGEFLDVFLSESFKGNVID